MSIDTVFSVKDDLVVDFKPREGDPKAKLDLEYNVVLAPREPQRENAPPMQGVSRL